MKHFGPGPTKRKSRRPPSVDDLRFLSPEEKELERLDALLGSALGDSGMSVRTVNCLETNGVATIGELAQMTQEELMKIPNFGEMTLSECINHLDRLKVPHPEWSLARKQKKKKS